MTSTVTSTKIGSVAIPSCKCEEKNCWSLTFGELVAPKGAVFVCVCLSLLKFTLFERGENRPPEALSNSFGRPHTASRDWTTPIDR